MLERSGAAAAAATGTVGEFLVVVAGILVEVEQRSAGLVVAALEAAAADPGVRPLARQLSAQRATTAEWIADGMIRRFPLRPGIDRAHAVDTVWLLMDPAVYRRLTIDRGWSAARFERWFADSAQRLLLSAPVQQGPTGDRP